MLFINYSHFLTHFLKFTYDLPVLGKFYLPLSHWYPISAILTELLAIWKHETLGKGPDKPGFVSIHHFGNTTLSISFLTCKM